MMPVLKRWLVVGMLTASLSTPWALLQSVAWFGMILSYSKDASMAKAVSMTFDGKHPCKICHLVQEGKKQEKQQDRSPAPQLEKLDLGLPPLPLVFLHPPMPAPHSEPIGSFASLSRQPPSPPPRAG